MSDVKEMTLNKSGQDITPTWVINKHGVKSCLPRFAAVEFVTKNVNFSYAEPDFVPEEKQYPMDGEFTEKGLKNRLAILEKRKMDSLKEVEKRIDNLEEASTPKAPVEVKASAVDYDMPTLRAMAKEKGIVMFQKGKDQLIRELGL